MKEINRYYFVAEKWMYLRVKNLRIMLEYF